MRRESNHPSWAQSMRVYDLRVWEEIQYLDSPTCYREYCVSQAPKPVTRGELEFLDDGARFPWGLLIQWGMGAAACLILIVIICISF